MIYLEMLVERYGSYYGSAPVRLSYHSKEHRFVMIGDEDLRFLLTGEEIDSLYKLLEPFVVQDLKRRASD